MYNEYPLVTNSGVSIMNKCIETLLESTLVFGLFQEKALYTYLLLLLIVMKPLISKGLMNHRQMRLWTDI